MRYLGKCVSALILAGVSIGSASSALAAASSGKYVYLGPKLQSFIVNNSAYSGQTVNLGIIGGYQLLGPRGKLSGNLGGGTLSVEGELSTTVVPGTFKYTYVCGFLTTCTANGDWKMNTFGVFAAYRYPSGNIEWKGKAGLQRYETKTTVDYTVGGFTTTYSATDSSIDPTVGGGLTMPMGPGKFEAELMLSPRSEDTFSIGIDYLFVF